ncbi:titin-like [Photinus pyralis]|uniref:titin-like n=1 Tax=Photinus pyralis TaxID=7054 RepID=UPI0012675D6B|nr:titin-like [Photinus pyralis]
MAGGNVQSLTRSAKKLHTPISRADTSKESSLGADQELRKSTATTPAKQSTQLERSIRSGQKSGDQDHSAKSFVDQGSDIEMPDESLPVDRSTRSGKKLPESPFVLSDVSAESFESDESAGPEELAFSMEESSRVSSLKMKSHDSTNSVGKDAVKKSLASNYVSADEELDSEKDESASPKKLTRSVKKLQGDSPNFSNEPSTRVEKSISIDLTDVSAEEDIAEALSEPDGSMTSTPARQSLLPIRRSTRSVKKSTNSPTNLREQNSPNNLNLSNAKELPSPAVDDEELAESLPESDGEILDKSSTRTPASQSRLTRSAIKLQALDDGSDSTGEVSFENLHVTNDVPSSAKKSIGQVAVEVSCEELNQSLLESGIELQDESLMQTPDRKSIGSVNKSQVSSRSTDSEADSISQGDSQQSTTRTPTKKSPKSSGHESDGAVKGETPANRRKSSRSTKKSPPIHNSTDSKNCVVTKVNELLLVDDSAKEELSNVVETPAKLTAVEELNRSGDSVQGDPQESGTKTPSAKKPHGSEMEERSATRTPASQRKLTRSAKKLLVLHDSIDSVSITSDATSANDLSFIDEEEPGSSTRLIEKTPPKQTTPFRKTTRSAKKIQQSSHSTDGNNQEGRQSLDARTPSGNQKKSSAVEHDEIVNEALHESTDSNSESLPSVSDVTDVVELPLVDDSAIEKGQDDQSIPRTPAKQSATPVRLTTRSVKKLQESTRLASHEDTQERGTRTPSAGRSAKKPLKSIAIAELFEGGDEMTGTPGRQRKLTRSAKKLPVLHDSIDSVSISSDATSANELSHIDEEDLEEPGSNARLIEKTPAKQTTPFRKTTRSAKKVQQSSHSTDSNNQEGRQSLDARSPSGNQKKSSAVEHDEIVNEALHESTDSNSESLPSISDVTDVVELPLVDDSAIKKGQDDQSMPRTPAKQSATPVRLTTRSVKKLQESTRLASHEDTQESGTRTPSEGRSAKKPPMSIAVAELFKPGDEMTATPGNQRKLTRSAKKLPGLHDSETLPTSSEELPLVDDSAEEEPVSKVNQDDQLTLRTPAKQNATPVRRFTRSVKKLPESTQDLQDSHAKTPQILSAKKPLKSSAIKSGDEMEDGSATRTPANKRTLTRSAKKLPVLHDTNDSVPLIGESAKEESESKSRDGQDDKFIMKTPAKQNATPIRMPTRSARKTQQSNNQEGAQPNSIKLPKSVSDEELVKSDGEMEDESAITTPITRSVKKLPTLPDSIDSNYEVLEVKELSLIDEEELKEPVCNVPDEQSPGKQNLTPIRQTRSVKKSSDLNSNVNKPDDLESKPLASKESSDNEELDEVVIGTPAARETVANVLKLTRSMSKLSEENSSSGSKQTTPQALRLNPIEKSSKKSAMKTPLTNQMAPSPATLTRSMRKKLNFGEHTPTSNQNVTDSVSDFQDNENILCQESVDNFAGTTAGCDDENESLSKRKSSISNMPAVEDFLIAPMPEETKRKRSPDLLSPRDPKRRRKPTPQSPANDLTDVKGVKKMFATPKPQPSPKNDLSDVKKLLKTPQIRELPENESPIQNSSKKSAIKTPLTNQIAPSPVALTRSMRKKLNFGEHTPTSNQSDTNSVCDSQESENAPVPSVQGDIILSEESADTTTIRDGSPKSSISNLPAVDDFPIAPVSEESKRKRSPDLSTPRDPKRRRKPIPKSPANDLTDVRGVKKLLKTPKVQELPENDLRDVRGVRHLFEAKRVQSPKNDLTDVRGVKKMYATPKIQQPPKNDLGDVRGVKMVLKTPKVQKEPKNDLSDLRGVKRVLGTPQIQNEPENDLRDVRGVRHLFEGKQMRTPVNDLTNVRGVKQLYASPRARRSPRNDITDVKGVKKLLKTPRPQREPKNDLTDVRGVRGLFEPAVSRSPTNDLSDFKGVRKMFRTPSQKADKSMDLSGVANLFEDEFDRLIERKPMRQYPGKASPKKSPLTREHKPLFDSSKPMESPVEKWVEEQNLELLGKNLESSQILSEIQNKSVVNVFCNTSTPISKTSKENFAPHLLTPDREDGYDSEGSKRVRRLSAKLADHILGTNSRRQSSVEDSVETKNVAQLEDVVKESVHDQETQPFIDSSIKPNESKSESQVRTTRRREAKIAKIQKAETGSDLTDNQKKKEVDVGRPKRKRIESKAGDSGNNTDDNFVVPKRNLRRKAPDNRKDESVIELSDASNVSEAQVTSTRATRNRLNQKNKKLEVSDKKIEPKSQRSRRINQSNQEVDLPEQESSIQLVNLVDSKVETEPVQSRSTRARSAKQVNQDDTTDEDAKPALARNQKPEVISRAKTGRFAKIEHQEVNSTDDDSTIKAASTRKQKLVKKEEPMQPRSTRNKKAAVQLQPDSECEEIDDSTVKLRSTRRAKKEEVIAEPTQPRSTRNKKATAQRDSESEYREDETTDDDSTLKPRSTRRAKKEVTAEARSIRHKKAVVQKHSEPEHKEDETTEDDDLIAKPTSTRRAKKEAPTRNKKTVVPKDSEAETTDDDSTVKPRSTRRVKKDEVFVEPMQPRSTRNKRAVVKTNQELDTTDDDTTINPASTGSQKHPKSTRKINKKTVGEDTDERVVPTRSTRARAAANNNLESPEIEIKETRKRGRNQVDTEIVEKNGTAKKAKKSSKEIVEEAMVELSTRRARRVVTFAEEKGSDSQPTTRSRRKILT